MLQTSSRALTVNVIKVEDLPKNPFTNSAPGKFAIFKLYHSDKFCTDPVVRITLEQGARSQTKQTRTIKHSCSAVWKEGVMFVIATDKPSLQQTRLTVAVGLGNFSDSINVTI